MSAAICRVPHHQDTEIDTSSWCIAPLVLGFTGNAFDTEVLPGLGPSGPLAAYLPCPASKSNEPPRAPRPWVPSGRHEIMDGLASILCLPGNAPLLSDTVQPRTRGFEQDQTGLGFPTLWSGDIEPGHGQSPVPSPQLWTIHNRYAGNRPAGQPSSEPTKVREPRDSPIRAISTDPRSEDPAWTDSIHPLKLWITLCATGDLGANSHS